MKKFVFCTLLFITGVILLLPSPALARLDHTVFFEGTDHELNVYRVYGKEPGKTILMIGGIQGDEPGGFLSADLYADMSLKKGNLIVVPRANFQSIVLNRRQINEDMNRKFAEDTRNNYETKVVEILKKLIAQSDCLLNLHDGSGFYSDTWENDQKNPNRFGQSVITDFKTFQVPGKDTVLDLEAMAQRAVKKINSAITNPDYYFHFSNHDTDSTQSLHKVQKKSATYYALKTYGIPAFGIETSKSLPLELKVRHHIYAINAFMEEFGVVPETPGINLEKPELDHIVVKINDALPIVVKNGQTLSINHGDTLTVLHIEANFERGLSADILETGNLNDLRKPLTITKPTRITIRKDSYPCGNINVSLGGGSGKVAENASIYDRPSSGSAFLMYRIKINSREYILENYATVKLIRGDLLTINDVIPGNADPSALIVNLKGYVGDSENNTGEDRGFVVDTAKDLWPRYSVNKRGRTYQVTTENDGKIIGKLFIELESPELKYLIMEDETGSSYCLGKGETVTVKSPAALNQISIKDIITNIETSSDLSLFKTGADKKKIKLTAKSPFNLLSHSGDTSGNSSGSTRIDVMRGDLLMGSVFFNYNQENRQNEKI